MPSFRSHLLHIPLLLAVGIGIYFAVPEEPAPHILPMLLFMLGFCLLWYWRYKRQGRILAFGWLALAFIIIGFVRAEWRAQEVAAPALERNWQGWLEGTIASTEPRGKGMRIVLTHLDMERLPAEKTPQNIRLTLTSPYKEGEALPRTGERVSLKAWLFPPSGPVLPGGFNLARFLWFKQIGAVGYSFLKPKVIASLTGQDNAPSSIQSLRESIAHKVRGILPAREAALALALLIGEKGGIGEEDYAKLRKSGLGHLMAISGLHMGLIAGLIFLLSRRLLACSERLALHAPLKKIAAIIALAGTGIYLLLAGAPISAQRAYIMLALVMVAILIDRKSNPLRLVAIAAIAILLLTPESLLTASFQLSFAAVVALISFYQWHMRRSHIRMQMSEGGYFSWWRKLLRYPLAVALSSLVASLATAPFSLYHFHMVSLYSMLANIIAIPLTAFWVLPAGLLSMMAMPFSDMLSHMALLLMGQGISFILLLMDTIAVWPELGWHSPPLTVWAMVACALAGLWLCIMPGKWRLVALPVMILALGSAWPNRFPDVLVEEQYVALRLQQGEAGSPWALIGPREHGNWVTDVWQENLPIDGWIPKESAIEQGVLACDALGCSRASDNHALVLLQRSEGWQQDCRQARTLVFLEYARLPRGASCQAKMMMAGSRAIKRDGVHAITMDADSQTTIWKSSDVNAGRLWGNK